MRAVNGWIPDFPDKRDKLFKKISKPIPIPRIVDLRAGCSMVEDQGKLGSCTAQALVANLEFLQVKASGQPAEDLSRLFVYYNERKIEGTINQDAGAQIRDGIKALVNWGSCPENLWPYKIEKFTMRPPDNCYNAGRSRRISSYHRLQNLDDMIQCLAEGFPFVFGFTAFKSFNSREVAKSGVLKMPTFLERSIGGHAVMAVGYDMNTKRFIVRNSFGLKWGQLGYFTFPFQYAEELSEDFWTIRA